MFTKFNDFINESRKINKEFEKSNLSINEGFSAKNMGKALGIMQRIIGRKFGVKVSDPTLNSAKCEYITSIDSKPRFGIRMAYLKGDTKMGIRFSWIGTSTGLNEIYEFSVFSGKDKNCVFWDRPTVTVGVKDFNTVRGLGIGYILTAAIKCLENPFTDVTPQDFVKSSLNESYENDLELSEEFENEVIYEIEESEDYEDVYEARVSKLNADEISRRDELFKKGKKGSTPEEWSEYLALKAASSGDAYFANSLEDLLRDLREHEKGVYFRFTKKDGSVRLAHGTTNPDLIKRVAPGKLKQGDTGDVTQTNADKPVVTYFDLQVGDWRAFTKSNLVVKQIKSAEKPAKKERLLTDDERRRRDELKLKGMRQLSPSERAEYDQLIAKSKGIENYVQEVGLSVSNVRAPKEKDLLLQESIDKAQKIIDTIKSSGDEQFERLERNVLLMTKGRRNSILITGQAGVGKTFTVTNTLESAGLVRGIDWFHIKGKATTKAVYEAFYRYRDKIIVFDDCDAVFGDDDTINILKGALDTSKVRELSWFSATTFVTDGMTQEEIHMAFDAYAREGKPKYPQSFEYSGSVIFISNLPMEKMDKALMSRSTTIDITLSPDEMRSRIVKRLDKIEPDVNMGIKEGILEIMDELIRDGIMSIMDFRTFIKAIPTYEMLSSSGASRDRLKKEIIIECVNYFDDIAVLKSKKR